MNWIPDANVLDLFAGSGALGLESISRGAKHAVLCDNSRKAIEIIKENVSKCKMQENVEILLSDYSEVLNKLNGKKFDIIFLDPPYKTDYDIDAIKIIEKNELLEKDGLIVIETDSDEKINKINIDYYNIFKTRKYGRVNLIFLSRKG